MKKNNGIHHITAIVGHPQENIDFYEGVLGLRLVKQTVNFDDPGTYHLYFGDEEGQPGTIITFFPWADAYKGKIGDGQVGVTSYAVPSGALTFWKNRLESFQIPFSMSEKFGEQILVFEDFHGLQLELVERESGQNNNWSFDGITQDTAIKGFAGATLFSSRPYETASLLEKGFGFEKIGEEGDLVRYQAASNIGNIIDLKKTSSGRGQMGAGTVHHIAWRAEDDHEQLQWKKHIESLGYGVTPVQDRNYFNAIYFREHGEILFEIATDPPGFAHDESKETMGQKLMLPEQYEQHREKIESVLIPIEVKNK